ncbi:MAG: DUF1570 domain-containing protein [Phycisphaerales bacterium]
MFQWARLGAFTALACAAALVACSDSGSGLSPTAASGTPAPVAKADSTTARSDTPASPTVNPALRGAAAFVRDTAPWSFDNAAGQIIKTDHFTIYTTCKAPAIMERLPGFMEAALHNYVSALVPLEYPDSSMESYFMANRSQWQQVSMQMLGARAKPLTQIQRGGFATMGRGFYFDIGAFDTLAVAGHEGWHQFTQRTFRESMPIWLEEGIATYMEGHRWQGGSPKFLPWANVERFDRLRDMASKKQLLSLQDLLGANSDRLISGGNSGVGLTYYAQLWALVHFLNEGENGKYHDALQRVVTDAAAGKLGQNVFAKLGTQANRPLARAVGPSVFLAYFDTDIGRVNVEYQAFVAKIAATGSREAVVEGRSPFQPRPGN